MRRIAGYIFILIVGFMIAFGISEFFGIYYPDAARTVFVVLCAWWLFTTWRYSRKRGPAR